VKALASHPDHARLHALLEVFAYGEGLAAFHKWHAAGGSGDKDLAALGISHVSIQRGEAEAAHGASSHLAASSLTSIPHAGALRRDDPAAFAVQPRLGQQDAELRRHQLRAAGEFVRGECGDGRCADWRGKSGWRTQCE